MQPSSPPSGGSLSSLASPRLLPLFLGVFGGGFVSLGVALAGVRSAVAVRWLLRLPGDLLLNAFVGLTLPVTGLHAVATGWRVTRGAKTQQTRWLQIAGATLGGFALSTLLASVLGVLLAMALQSIVPNSTSLAQVWGFPSGASVAFVCPGEAASGSVALQSDGTLKCSANATTFVLDDVARTFVVDSTMQVSSVTEQVVKVAESVLPESLARAFVDGDVLSLVVGGLVLGVAMACFALTESGQDTDEGGPDLGGDYVLLQLVAQAEAVLCRVLNWLQKYLPITVAFMISGVLLQSSASLSSDTGDNETAVAAALALMSVLLLALVVDVVVMLVLASLITRSNPFAFLKHLLAAQLLALSSGSALVALPATVSSVVASKRVSPPLAFIVCAASSVLNQTGTALYLSVSTLFVLTVSSSGMNGDELAASQSASTIAAMMFVNALVANVATPLPKGGKSAALATTLGAVFGISAGTRAELLAFMAALEWITDPFVACVNVTNNALVALVVAHFFEDEPVAATAADPDNSGAMHESPTPNLHQQRALGVVHSENWV
ncbi:hypothetical protein PRNP1_008198 [Phytophthora ramorum]